MTKRTKVELFEQIRKAHVGSESPSIRDLARTYGVHRRTVRQALSDPVPSARKVTPRASPSLEPWKRTTRSTEHHAGSDSHGPGVRRDVRVARQVVGA